MRALRGRLGRRAAATVELAVAFPAVVLLLGNIADGTLMLRRHAQLAGGVANAASYAARIGGDVAVGTLQSIATSSSWLTGASASVSAVACHCPAGTPRVLGAAVACGAACADGTTAAKYVTISGSYNHSPLFPSVIGAGARTLAHSATVMLK
jgi:hypothetical protein